MGTENPFRAKDTFYVWNTNGNGVFHGDPNRDGQMLQKWGVENITIKVATDGWWHTNPARKQNVTEEYLKGFSDQGIDVGGWFFYNGTDLPGTIAKIGQARDMYAKAGFDLQPLVDIEVTADRTGPKVMKRFIDMYRTNFPDLDFRAVTWAQPRYHAPVCQVLAGEADMISPMAYHAGSLPVYAEKFTTKVLDNWKALGVPPERVVMSLRSYLGDGGYPTPQTLDASRKTVARLAIPGGIWWYFEPLELYGKKWGITPETIKAWEPYESMPSIGFLGMAGEEGKKENFLETIGLQAGLLVSQLKADIETIKAGELTNSKGLVANRVW
jgi:hypothetical protein